MLVCLKKEQVAKLQTGYIKENLHLVNCWNHDPSKFKQFMSKRQVFDISYQKWFCSNHSNITISSKIKIKPLSVSKQFIFTIFMNNFKNILEIVNKKPLSIFLFASELKKQLFTHICCSNYPEKELFQSVTFFLSSLFQKIAVWVFPVLQGSLWYWKLCKWEWGAKVSPKSFFSFFLFCYCDKFVCVCVFKNKCFLISSSVLC